jgi:nitroreductase
MSHPLPPPHSRLQARSDAQKLIEEIIALAMRAPSSMNTQPWISLSSPANRSTGSAPAIPSG